MRFLHFEEQKNSRFSFNLVTGTVQESRFSEEKRMFSHFSVTEKVNKNV